MTSRMCSARENPSPQDSFLFALNAERADGIILAGASQAEGEVYEPNVTQLEKSPGPAAYNGM